jgi:hypothetical protein
VKGKNKSDDLERSRDFTYSLPLIIPVAGPRSRPSAIRSHWAAT